MPLPHDHEQLSQRQVAYGASRVGILPRKSRDTIHAQHYLQPSAFLADLFFYAVFEWCQRCIRGRSATTVVVPRRCKQRVRRHGDEPQTRLLIQASSAKCRKSLDVSEAIQDRSCEHPCGGEPAFRQSQGSHGISFNATSNSTTVPEGCATAQWRAHSSISTFRFMNRSPRW